MSQLVEALAARLTGCRIHYNQQVERLLADDGDGWRVDVADRLTGDRRQEAYAGVILALPAWHAGSLLMRANRELAALVAQISYAGCVVVNLGYDRSAVSHPLDSFGFVAPHIERRSVLACTFSSVKYPGRAPEGKALFRAYLGGACFPEVLEWPDERVLRVVQDELRQLLGVAGPPLIFRITRWPRSMAQYHVGHLDRVRRIEELVSNLPGLELAGNSYHGVGIPQCIRGGEQASERLLATLGHDVQLQPETRSG
jgi:oxygen-dependent protoporphyrinogen oxidase